MRDYGKWIICIALIIAAISVLSIYSSNYQKEGNFWQSIYKRQMLWTGIGLLLFLFMSNLDYRRLWDLTYFLYGAAVFLLFLVFVSGIVRLGAQRWLRFGWFNLQPSEIAKPVMAVFLARYFSRKSADDISLPVKKFGVFKGLILPFIYVIVPTGLIIQQPDLGSGIIVLLIFMMLVFSAGVQLRYIFLLGLFSCLAVPLGWNFLRSYQKNRILVFLNPEIDPLGAGYTVIQSKIAVGSGGLLGKGWLLGTQSQLHFLPESHTDFIFATFAEEWGFVGCVVLLLLYYLLIRIGINIAVKTNDYFGKMLAVGIVSMLFIQVTVNIAMNIGIAPVVGIPLPLMSYGGSAMLVNFMALGILVSIAKKRAVF